MFCGNCYSEKERIKEFFEQAGEVGDVRQTLDGEGQPKGYSHIEFAKPEDALYAVKKLNNKDLDGKRVRLDISAKRENRKHNSNWDKPQ